MAHIFEVRVLETTTTTGTGALTLAGALTGFRTWASVCAVNDTAWYYIEAVDANGNATGDYEAGLGTYSAASQLTRTTVLRSSNANAAVNLAAGTKRVGLTLIANRVLELDNQLVVRFPAVAAEPNAPPTGFVSLYARELLPGYVALKTVRPSGVDSPLQDDLSFNEMAKHVANNTVILGIGCAAPTVVGTASAQAKTSGSAKTNVKRVRYTSAATAAALSSWVQPTANNRPMFRGAVNGEGGFRYLERFALTTLVAGNRAFWGLAASVTAQTGAAIDPAVTAAPARVGLGFNANTGNWQFYRTDGTTAPTAIDLGANFPLNGTDLIELLLFSRPHNGSTAGDITYRVRRYTTNSNVHAFETTGTLSTNLPAATTLLHPWFFFSNNATAAAVAWDFAYDAHQSDW